MSTQKNIRKKYIEKFQINAEEPGQFLLHCRKKAPDSFTKQLK